MLTDAELAAIKARLVQAFPPVAETGLYLWTDYYNRGALRRWVREDAPADIDALLTEVERLREGSKGLARALFTRDVYLAIWGSDETDSTSA